MKVEIDDKFINLSASAKAEIRKLKTYIKKLEHKLSRQDEEIRKLRWKANEVEDLQTELKKTSRIIKDFLELGTR